MDDVTKEGSRPLLPQAELESSIKASTASMKNHHLTPSIVIGTALFGVGWLDLGWWRVFFWWWSMANAVNWTINRFDIGDFWFGKKKSGRQSVRARLLWGPHLVAMLTIMRVLAAREKRKANEASYNEIEPGLFIGERPDSIEALPPGTTMVIDLTNEIYESESVISGVDVFRCYPLTDFHSPSDIATFKALIDEACEHHLAQRGNIYIHCLKGRNRSALFTAALLLRLHETVDIETVHRQLISKRPTCMLLPMTKTFLEHNVSEIITGVNKTRARARL